MAYIPEFCEPAKRRPAKHFARKLQGRGADAAARAMLLLPAAEENSDGWHDACF
jgi:hypothetical protein